MNDKVKAAHYVILTSLYDLYLRNQSNTDVLDVIAKICWSLGVDLNFDYGYHELSELAQGAKAGSSEGAEHYMQVIERNLASLTAS